MNDTEYIIEQLKQINFKLDELKFLIWKNTDKPEIKRLKSEYMYKTYPTDELLDKQEEKELEDAKRNASDEWKTLNEQEKFRRS